MQAHMRRVSPLAVARLAKKPDAAAQLKEEGKMTNPGGSRFLLWIGLTVAALIAVAGCSKSDDAASTGSTPSYSAKAGSSPAYSNGAVAGGAMPQDVNAGEGARFGSAPLHDAVRQPGGQRSVLRSANLSVDVENLDTAEKKMKQAVKDAGGYIDHEEGDQLASETPVMTLTIRVPEKSFDDILTGFEALGHRTQKSIMASDLTEQILDYEAQVKQVQQDNKSATDPSLAEHIKQLQAERDALQAQAAMSTIDLTLQQKPNAGFASAASASWGSDTWNAALSCAMGAMRIVGALAIWLLAFGPLWVPIALVALWLYRSHRRTVGKTPRRTQVA